VLGTIGEAPQAFHVVQTPEDVDRLEIRNPDKLVHLTQTTISVTEAAEVIARLRERFPKIVGPSKDDICYATQNRQQAVRTLAPKADIVLVVGSTNSSNSQRLKELAESDGVPAHLIDGPDDIVLAWFSGRETVLITAGASAPEMVVQQCVTLLQERFAAEVQSLTACEEQMSFSLPKELR